MYYMFYIYFHLHIITKNVWMETEFLNNSSFLYLFVSIPRYSAYHGITGYRNIENNITSKQRQICLILEKEISECH